MSRRQEEREVINMRMAAEGYRLREENNQLKARVIELEEALIEQARYEVDRGDGSVDLVIDDDVIEILNRQQPQSLEAHDREVAARALDRWATRIYNNGYLHGHYDTVEGQYVDIAYSELDTYHKEEVDEFVVEFIFEHIRAGGEKG